MERLQLNLTQFIYINIFLYATVASLNLITVSDSINEDCIIDSARKSNRNEQTCQCLDKKYEYKPKLCFVAYCASKSSRNCWTLTNASQYNDKNGIADSTYKHKTCQCRDKVIPDSEEITFDQNYLGVIYAPFDTYQKGWKDYDPKTVTNQLNLVSSKFRNISMYGMSTIGVSDSWRDGIRHFGTAPLVAELNTVSKTLKLSMVIGIFRNIGWETGEPGLAEEEIEAAANSAKIANKLFPNSVWGISIHMDYHAEPFDIEVNVVLRLLILLRKQIHNQDNTSTAISTGIRLWHCSSYSHAAARNGSTSIFPNNKMEAILKLCDFVICVVSPRSIISLGRDFPPSHIPIFSQASAVMKTLRQVRHAFQNIAPATELIGETGMPVGKLADSDFATNIKSFQDYWFRISDLASSNGIRVFLYEAIDQRWKADVIDTEGKYYYKPHCGWWERVQNDTTTFFVEKVTGNKFIVDLPKRLDWTLIGGVSGCIMLLLLIGCGAFAVYKLRGFKKMKKKLKETIKQVEATKSQPALEQRYIELFREGKSLTDDNDDDNDVVTIPLRLPYDRKYELALGDFSYGREVVGMGSSGKVYKGIVKGNIVCAFKTVSGNSSLLAIKNLMSEIKIRSYLGCHPHIVALIGAYTDEIEKGIIHAAFEFCDFGSLESILQYSQPATTLQCRETWISSCSSNSGKSKMGDILSGYSRYVPVVVQQVEFTLLDLYQWSYEIASGMEYVATLGVVHADLAIRNILITKDRHAKITDFGLSRKMYNSLVVTFDGYTFLPWRYMAPESLRHLTFSSESDVWAFGVTLWEIFSLGRIPYLDREYTLQFIEDLENSKLITSPRYAGPEVSELMTSCWQLKPEDRPNFTTLRTQLANMLGTGKNDLKCTQQLKL